MSIKQHKTSQHSKFNNLVYQLNNTKNHNIQHSTIGHSIPTFNIDVECWDVLHASKQLTFNPAGPPTDWDYNDVGKFLLDGLVVFLGAFADCWNYGPCMDWAYQSD